MGLLDAGPACTLSPRTMRRVIAVLFLLALICLSGFFVFRHAIKSGRGEVENRTGEFVCIVLGIISLHLGCVATLGLHFEPANRLVKFFRYAAFVLLGVTYISGFFTVTGVLDVAFDDDEVLKKYVMSWITGGAFAGTTLTVGLASIFQYLGADAAERKRFNDILLREDPKDKVDLWNKWDPKNKSVDERTKTNLEQSFREHYNLGRNDNDAFELAMKMSLWDKKLDAERCDSGEIRVYNDGKRLTRADEIVKKLEQTFPNKEDRPIGYDEIEVPKCRRRLSALSVLDRFTARGELRKRHRRRFSGSPVLHRLMEEINASHKQ